MGFVDTGFWLAVLPVALILRLLPARRRAPLILLASLGYVALVSGAWVLLLVAQIAWCHHAGQRVARAATDRARLAWLWLGLAPAAGALVLFKAGDALPGLIAPLGISYYTFKLIAYLIEIYWDETQAEPGWIDFAAAIAFMPQLPSGPIQRPGDFLAQVHARRFLPDPQEVDRGIHMILVGLMLKLILADRIGGFVTPVDADPGAYARQAIDLACLAHLPYLYADFAGYSLIALGLGRLLGIVGPANFAAPFAAASVPEYWRRWHISLTGWLTDYVFMPIRMATRGWGRAGLVVSIFANMILVGLWHRITWTYLAFGLMQGAFMTAAVLHRPWLDRQAQRRPWLGTVFDRFGPVLVFALMSAAMVVWFAPDLGHALREAAIALGLAPGGARRFDDLPGGDIKPLVVALALAIHHGAGSPGLRRVSGAYARAVPSWLRIAVKLLALSLFSQSGGGAFIYGQF